MSSIIKTWSDLKAIQFIEAIENTPAIYDKNWPSYVSEHEQMKNGLWDPLALQFETDALTLEKLWHSLKEKWVRERKVFRNSGVPTTWKFWENLCFLNDKIATRNRGKSSTIITVPFMSKSDDSNSAQTLVLSPENSTTEKKSDGLGGTKKVLWDEAKIIRFIHAVKKLPVIYDKNHEDFYRKAEKESAWISLGNEFGTDYNSVEAFWWRMKAKWMQERKHLLGNSSVSSVPLEELVSFWKFWRPLCFLEEHDPLGGEGENTSGAKLQFEKDPLDTTMHTTELQNDDHSEHSYSSPTANWANAGEDSNSAFVLLGNEPDSHEVKHFVPILPKPQAARSYTLSPTNAAKRLKTSDTISKKVEVDKATKTLALQVSTPVEHGVSGVSSAAQLYGQLITNMLSSLPDKDVHREGGLVLEFLRNRMKN